MSNQDMELVLSKKMAHVGQTTVVAMHDNNLIALLAAHRPDVPPAEAVAWAIELLVETVAQGGAKLIAKIDKRLQENLHA